MQVKRAFKSSSFFVTNKKGDMLCLKFSSIPNASVLQVLNPFIQNKRPLILLRILFQRISIQVRVNKIINEHSADYETSPSELTSDTWSHISIDSLEFYLSQEFLLDFLSNLNIPPWLGKIFKLMLFRLLENAFASQTFESIHFYSCPSPGKTSHILIFTPKEEENYPFSAGSFFSKIYSSKQKGGTMTRTRYSLI